MRCVLHLQYFREISVLQLFCLHLKVSFFRQLRRQKFCLVIASFSLSGWMKRDRNQYFRFPSYHLPRTGQQNFLCIKFCIFSPASIFILRNGPPHPFLIHKCGTPSVISMLLSHTVPTVFLFFCGEWFSALPAERIPNSHKSCPANVAGKLSWIFHYLMTYGTSARKQKSHQVKFIPSAQAAPPH